MNSILLIRKNGKAKAMQLDRRNILISLMVVVPLVAGLLIYVGYSIGTTTRVVAASSELLLQRSEATSAQVQMEDAGRSLDIHLNALALHLGQMKAQLTRVNALGKKLVEVAGLDAGEFDFDQLPGSGGAADPGNPHFTTGAEFIKELNSLSRQLDNRKRQFAVMDELLINKSVQDDVFPAGRPVGGGWVSSSYGSRTNPFNGSREFHKGIDFAGKRKSKIVAVAAGMVTISQRRMGYGNIIEINHGNGYVTRYAHNHRNLVSKGHRVEKGQLIALMGSTGKSTGPHVHFEVLLDGRTVNPSRYVKAGS